MKLIAPEDVCIKRQAIIQNSKSTGKFSPRAKSFVALRNSAAHRKEIRVFSAFCLRLRAGYVTRVKTIRLSSVSDPKKKIASVREATSSPVIANSRDYSRRNQKASAVLKICRGSISEQYDPEYNRKILATYWVLVPSLWNKLK